MNVTLHSNKPLDVVMFMSFTDKNTWQARAALSGRGPCNITVIGRWPHDLVTLEFFVLGIRYGHPIEVDPKSPQNLKPIVLSGDRDHWSQLLRNKALEGYGR